MNFLVVVPGLLLAVLVIMFFCYFKAVRDANAAKGRAVQQQLSIWATVVFVGVLACMASLILVCSALSKM
jgi:heme/copper-type cytochrome/quinol oxidase subunit 2